VEGVTCGRGQFIMIVVYWTERGKKESTRVSKGPILYQLNRVAKSKTFS